MISANPPKKTVDSKIKELCNLPVKLPEKELSQKETEGYWTIDRQSLVDCYNKHKARIALDGVK